MVFTWYRELGLAIEKHSTTTSDLKTRWIFSTRASAGTEQWISHYFTFHMQNGGPYDGLQKYPKDEGTHLHRLLHPWNALKPKKRESTLINI